MVFSISKTPHMACHKSLLRNPQLCTQAASRRFIIGKFICVNRVWHHMHTDALKAAASIHPSPRSFAAGKIVCGKKLRKRAKQIFQKCLLTFAPVRCGMAVTNAHRHTGTPSCKQRKH